MRRIKRLVGYEVIDGVIFANYKKYIEEDDLKMTDDGSERETITQELYDEIKLSNFTNKVLLEHAKEVHDVAVVRDEYKEQKEELETQVLSLVAEKEALITEKSVLISEKETLLSEKETLLLEKETLIAEKEVLLEAKG